MNNPFHFIALKRLAFFVTIVLFAAGCVTTPEKPSMIQTPLPHDVDALLAQSACRQLTTSGRMVSFPPSCLNMTVDAYTTSGQKEAYRLTRSGLLKAPPRHATLILPAGAAVLETPCDGMRIRPLAHATRVEFPPACQGETLRVLVDDRKYRTRLRQGEAELIPLQSRPTTKPKRQPKKVPSRKPRAPKPPPVPMIEIGDWAYEKTARKQATHRKASEVCRGLGMGLPPRGAFSQAIGLRGLSLSQPGEWGGAVNTHEAFMIHATPRGGDYKVIYKNDHLPYRCARKIK
uniref:Uncharacterized protein n=1 Tax=Candidatus Kentrum eta TaxID=2126337 RepID=A0A450V1E3_9GAMM|nr:MAG: hypothetical protein BECKH772A_GA0070896_100263 [Candidatus Kentron sp. H]VFJ92007.1 MAG: hypothetical protein BECKH772B_GA0070898_100243 [Candidatus Kentron sp. H]VFJ98589.1 MAG: hypothetical protein BECKH772C_GA0070978_100233 [Candidatus Kentron sp. H]